MKARTRKPPEFGPLKNHYIWEWRQFRKTMSLRRLADRLSDPASNSRSISDASLSRIERGFQPYNQPQLEAIASALNCTPADLIMRDPLDTEAPWSIWDALKPHQRQLAVRILRDLQESEAA